jgi:hypothetical protein
MQLTLIIQHQNNDTDLLHTDLQLPGERFMPISYVYFCSQFICIHWICIIAFGWRPFVFILNNLKYDRSVY